jgi:subtilisin family serine protease
MRRQLRTSLTAVLVAVATVVVAPAARAAETARPAARTTGEPVRITLITGDRVTTGAGGSVSVQPGPGRAGMKFLSRVTAGHRYVVPADALPLLRTGRVDQRLFDVTALTGFGYTGTELPLLIAYPASGNRAARSAAGVPGARIDRDLTSVGALAVRADLAAGNALWTSLTGGGASARGLRPGVDRVYLDGKRRISLDVSVPQIGAPAAWRAGLDGAGVKVAVLDTGIDATHPDFAGRIAAGRNFTDTPDTDDTVGHGTHVASTVAGTGAASGGRYRGVAPGAQLVIGKVCGTEFCEESDILAGMEWAAAQAPVVNMSLTGGDAPSIDPLEQAVEDLTAAHGALFVIAAGNDGSVGSVGSPGTADSALSVGAVDRDDQLADFSSRGPRVGDDAIKPDITAPGVEIVAARAANDVIGGPAPDGYSTLSGTSMATPHVAGAAAILTQQHPDLSPRDRKTLLMAAAAPTAGLDVLAQGAGRVDVARAITQTVAADEGSLSFGRQLWPHDDDVPVTRTVTYRNHGTAPVTLALALSTTDTFRLGATTLTVPAGGTAATTVTADTRGAGPDGFRTGHLTATAPGGVRVQTPVAVNREVESYDVKLVHTGRDGRPAGEFLTVLTDLDTGASYDAYGSERVTTIRVPKGRYGTFTWIYGETDFTMLVQPAIVVDRAVTLRPDARKAGPVRVTVPRKDATPSLVAVNADWTGDDFSLGASGLSDTFAGLFAGQLGPRTPVPGFTGSLNVSFAKLTGETFRNSPYTYDLLYHRKGRFFTGFTRTVRNAELATVRARYAAEATGAEGVKTNLGRFAGYAGGWSVLLPFDLPFRRTEYVNTDGGLTWGGEFSQQLPPVGDDWPEWLSGSSSPATRLEPGATYRQEWNRAVFAPSVAGDIDAAVRAGDVIGVGLPLFSEGSGNLGSSVTDTARVALYSGDRLIGENADQWGEFEVPAADAPYRLEVSATRGAPFRLSTAVSATWTFRSATGDARLPLSTVRFSPRLDDRNAAPAGRAFTVPVTVERQKGSAATRNRVLGAEVSYDDGRTWRPAAVSGSGDRRTLRVTHPAGTGFVSLRVNATDTAGNTVTQTVIRAYAIG